MLHDSPLSMPISYGTGSWDQDGDGVSFKVYLKDDPEGLLFLQCITNEFKDRGGVRYRDKR